MWLACCTSSGACDSLDLQKPEGEPDGSGSGLINRNALPGMGSESPALLSRLYTLKWRKNAQRVFAFINAQQDGFASQNGADGGYELLQRSAPVNESLPVKIVERIYRRSLQLKEALDETAL